MTICSRCHTETIATITSKFNSDVICMDCKADEQQSPNYARASAAEVTAVRNGDYNFPGIGLAPEDSVFLEAKRKARNLRQPANRQGTTL